MRTYDVLQVERINRVLGLKPGGELQSCYKKCVDAVVVAGVLGSQNGSPQQA
jgi:hypothetical protein